MSSKSDARVPLAVDALFDNESAELARRAFLAECRYETPSAGPSRSASVLPP